MVVPFVITNKARHTCGAPVLDRFTLGVYSSHGDRLRTAASNLLRISAAQSGCGHKGIGEHAPHVPGGRPDGIA